MIARLIFTYVKFPNISNCFIGFNKVLDFGEFYKSDVQYWLKKKTANKVFAEPKRLIDIEKTEYLLSKKCWKLF